MRAIVLGLAVAIATAVVASASAPETSPRPVPRPNASNEAAIRAAVDRAMAAANIQGGQEVAEVDVSPRPDTRPENLKRKTVVRNSGLLVDRVRPQMRTPICGFADVQGERISRIPGRVQGCGVAAPVRVTAVSGIALSQPTVMDCPTLAAFRSWIDDGMRPAIGRLGGGVSRIEIAGHYVCRTRNHRPGAKISEHGKGKAVDVSGFTLENGTRISVLRGWRDRDHGRRLRQMHRAACGTFGTVLGPDSDRFHQDHFHFDTARHRGGSYCR